MLLGARQFFERRGAPTPPLPYDAEVEFLESSGTQYIDCDLYVASTSSETLWVGDCGYINTVYGGRQFVAAYDNPNYSHYCEFNSERKFGLGGAYINATVSNRSVNRVALRLSPSTSTTTVYLDYGGAGQVLASTSSYQSTTMGRFVLFRLDNGYGSTGVRIGANKLYFDGVLVRDFIPVRVGTVGYMYDRVSGTLFGNAGSGAFYVGPDKGKVFTAYIDYAISAYYSATIPLVLRSINIASSFDVEIGIRFSEVLSSGYCGTGYTSKQSQFFIACSQSNGLYMAFNGATNVVTNLSQDKTAWHTVKAVASGGYVEYYFDGASVGRFQFIPFVLEGFSLFALAIQNNPATSGYQEIGYAKLSVDGTLILDVSAVRVGGEGAMWDSVNETLHYSDTDINPLFPGPDKL